MKKFVKKYLSGVMVLFLSFCIAACGSTAGKKSVSTFKTQEFDALTGAYSRRYFETYLTHMEGMECVEIIDVDHFKQVNDTYGHLAGDVVLKDITAAIQSCIRSTDILIRYGGDEFLLLFPKLSEKNMLEKNKKIKKAVENIVFTEYPDLHVTVSIGGVCGVHPIMEAIHQADKLMYENKRML